MIATSNDADRERLVTSIRISLFRSVSAAALGVAAASILGRGLGVTGYGRYQLIANLAAQIGQLCEAGVGTAIIALQKDGHSRVDSSTSALFRFFTAMAIPTLLLTAWLTTYFIKEVQWPYVAAACAVSLATLAQALVIGAFRTNGMSRSANTAMIIPPLINLPLIAILWGAGMLTPLAALTILAFAFSTMLLFSVLRLFQLARSLEWHCPTPQSVLSLADLFRVSWKSTATRLSQLLIYRFDLFLLAYFVGEESIGAYVPAVFLASQLNHVGDSVGFILYPSLARKETTPVQAGEACRRLMLVSCVFSMAIAIGSPLAIRLIWGSAYSGALQPLFLLLPGYLMLTPGKALSAYLAVETKFNATLKASMAGLSVNCLFNVILIPTYGAIGAAIATSMALACISLVLSYDFRLKTGVSMRDLWIPRFSDVNVLQKLISGKH